MKMAFPVSSSSRCSCRVIAGWVRPSRRAVSVMLPVSTTEVSERSILISRLMRFIEWLSIPRWADPCNFRAGDARRTKATFVLTKEAAVCEGRNRNACALLDPASELVRLRKTLRRQTAGVGAVAAPVRQFLDRGAEFAAGGILPGQAILGIECRDIRQAAVLVFLQAHAAAARHLRHLIDRKQQKLAVIADDGDGVAGYRRQGAGFVRHLDVQHLLALAGVADAIILVDDKTLPFMARHHEFASALVAEQRHDRCVLLHIDEHPDRLAMAAPARQF